MELRRHLAVLRRRILLIILCVAVGGAIAYATTSRTSVYTARSRIYVGTKQIVESGSVSNDMLVGLERVIRTYALMIDSVTVAADALKRVPRINITADQLVAATTAFGEPQTQLLTVRVASTDPVVAQELTNAVTAAFVDKIQTYDPATPPAEGQPPQQPAYVFETAKLPVTPAASQVPRRVILGLLFGFVFSAGVAFLIEYLDITVKGVADAERRLELPVLGVIPVERQRALVPVRSQASVVT